MARHVLFFTESVVVDAPVERVFWFTIAPNRPAKLDPDVSYWEPQELPPRTGTLNKMKFRTILGVSVRVVSRFDVFDPPHRAVISGVRPFIGPWTTLFYTFEPLSDQRSVCSVRVQVTYPRGAALIARVMVRVLRRLVRTANGETAHRLRQEGSSRP